MNWRDIPDDLYNAFAPPAQQGMSGADYMRGVIRNESTPDNIDRWANLATGGGGMGGWTRLVRSPGLTRIEALHNITNKPMGSMGFREMPGRGGRIMDIQVKPEGRGPAGYTDELLNAFENYMGPQRMNDVGIGSTITNSPGFWERLADRWAQYPQTSQNIRSALEMSSWGR